MQTYFKADHTSTANDGSFQVLQEGVNNSTGTSESDNEADLHLIIGRLLEQLVPNEIRTVKVAIGGQVLGQVTRLRVGQLVANSEKVYYPIIYPLQYQIF